MIKKEIIKLIEKATGEKNVHLEKPENSSYGDYSTSIALRFKKNPQEIIEKLKSPSRASAKGREESKLSASIFERIEAAGPGFINFWVSKKELEKLFLKVRKKGVKAFQKKPENRETIVVEYSSPNIAKPLGVHHLRSTIIGQSLVNILRFYGHKTISLSFPGDWGTQFGLLIAAYKRWGDKKKLQQRPIAEMLSLYVRFSQATKKDPSLLNQGREEFKKLEQGDKENRRFWKWFSLESYREFNRAYAMLDVKVENTIGESFYEKKAKALIRDALKRGIAEYGKDGAIIIKIPGSSVPEIIQKSDGATIYTTRELVAISHRLKKWRASKILYVAANQQTFHLSQVFGAAEKLGIAQKKQLLHIKFGMMLGPQGKKFATREGKIIPLEELLKEAIARSQKIVEKLNPALSKKEKEKVAEIVGVGAVKFFDLARNRQSDIIFNWEQMLNLKGFSAPYIQYTYARLSSILRKARFQQNKNFSFSISHNLEKELAIIILDFDEVVQDVAENYYPYKLAEYLYKLANVLNSFYETLPVLKEEKSIIRSSRLNLVYVAKEVLKTGLGLLGIQAPEQM